MLAGTHGHHPVHNKGRDPTPEVVLRDGLLAYLTIALVDRARTPDRDHHADGTIFVPRLVIPLDWVLHELEGVLVDSLLLRVDQVVAVRHDGDGEIVVGDVPVVSFFDNFVASDAGAFGFISGVDFDLVVEVTSGTDEFFEVCVLKNKYTFAYHEIYFVCPGLRLHEMVFDIKLPFIFIV